jgi:hypothetical protein
MLLLVGVAAVFFLYQRNTQLEEDLRQAGAAAASQVVVSEATREHLLSDVAVRQAALDAVSATRDTLAAEMELNTQESQDMEASLEQQASRLAAAEAALQSLALQIFIISPADNVTVPPMEPIDIIATARSASGLDTISLMVDSQELVRLPADGQTTLTAQTEWTPPAEGQFEIGAQALALDTSSTAANVTINAAYASSEARDAALRRQLEAATGELRFPMPMAAADVAPEAAQPVSDMLHALLLTGSEAEDQQAFADEALTLQALELLISDGGLRAYLDSVVAAGLSAYYDPSTEVLTIYEPGESTGAFGRWSGIHELAHDLQRERFNLDKLDINALDVDERLALRALVEGDAVFLQHLMLQNETMTAAEKAEVNARLNELATETTAALPIPLQETFNFAYEVGVPFVQFLHDLDGYNTVDGAWSELPASSEQLIHPERYLARDMPRAVLLAPLSGILGEGWRLAGEDAFGEFYLRQHLGRQPLPTASIDLAATGWGGGRYAVYHNPDDEVPVVVIRLAWDRAEDQMEFNELYAEYLGLRYSGEEQAVASEGRCWMSDGVGCLYQAGDDTLIIRAPSLGLAEAAAGAQLNMSQP